PYDLSITTPNNGGTTLSIDPVTDDNVLNITEAEAGVSISGSVGGEFSEGDQVTLTINGVTYTTAVNAAGEWSVEVAGSDLAADRSEERGVGKEGTDWACR